jgi:YVTN family beta-propeller protein
MKKPSILLIIIFIFGLSATGHTFEGIFERSIKTPVAQSKNFNANEKRGIAPTTQSNKFNAKGERGIAPVTETKNFNAESETAILKVSNGAGDDEAIKVSSAIISINGNEVLSSSNFNQNFDYMDTVVDLNVGDNSLEVLLKSKPGGRIKVVIEELGSGDSDGHGTYPNAVIATIPLGTYFAPYGEIAVSPYGNYIYVSNFNENTVSVIQTSNNTVIKTIDVGLAPFGVSVTPDG